MDAHVNVTQDGNFTIRPLDGLMGAEIEGLNLSATLEAPVVHDILDAFLAHHILIFRNQDLSKEAQVSFTENFGELEGHVHRLPNGKKLPPVHIVNNLDPEGRPTAKPHTTGNYHWHTDKSYHAVPSLTTMLHAVELPESGGGDTQFANTKRGYDALSDTMKTRIADMKVEHSWEASRRNVGAPPPNAAQISERPPVVHPIVRTHPDTGDKTLYLGHHMSHIVGLDKAESDALLEELSDHTTQDEFVYTHQWRTGDYVMWDNRLLLHRAMPNYKFSKDRRLLHRTVVIGTAPY